jgi:DNA (cytosine-5)-methyltransferase 1
MRGLERGIERAIGNVRTVAYVEIEAFVVENLVRQMEQGVLAPTPIWSNLKTFPWAEFHGKIHGITGGYPCQPFSVAGNRKGTDDPRHLWLYIKEGIRAVKPVWCFFENVPGHLTLGYREVRSDLEELGYEVEEGIFSAEEVGAPHQRKRLFILAVENSYRESMRGDVGGLYRETTPASPTLAHHNCKWEPQQERGIEKIGNGIVNGSEDMADTNNSGSGENTERCEFWAESPLQPSCDCRGAEQGEDEEIPQQRWPSRPNESQYEWEPPRIESSVGYVLNGYNFREDLLRMAGNGVVEQTAELAFKTLLEKFGG